MHMRIPLLSIVATLVVLCLPPVGSAGPPPGGIRLDESYGPSSTYLSRCSKLHGETTIWNCYVTRLLADVERSKDPASELPRIDTKVRAGGGYLESNCHMMMHVVGRTYARRHHVTLANLQRYLPRSNDPGCSAGFGMGMVMTLGAQIGELGPNGAVQLCMRAPTRFRSYTCVHTLGHAYMRLYHGQLAFALRACSSLPARQAPDCAQGVYHDYWLGIAGRDSAKPQRHAPATARTLCARAATAYVRGCWFRFFLELPPKKAPQTAAGVRHLCSGLAGPQRSGCIAAASLVTSPDPFRQMQICARLHGPDGLSCVFGVNVQNLATAPGSKRVELIERCRLMRPNAQSGCYRRLGTTLAVITNGRFRDRACPFIEEGGRSACLVGARRMNDALISFS
jgi:hypothetical protein